MASGEGWFGQDTTPCPATGRMGEACQRDTPAKTDRPGPSADEQTCQGGGASAGPERARSSLCALAGFILPQASQLVQCDEVHQTEHRTRMNDLLTDPPVPAFAAQALPM